MKKNRSNKFNNSLLRMPHRINLKLKRYANKQYISKNTAIIQIVRDFLEKES